MNFFKTLAMVGLVGVGMVYGEDAPQQINLLSPDGKWVFKTEWVKQHDDYDSGYNYYINRFNDTNACSLPPSDTKLPERLSGLWSPDSHYIAVTEYYGRATQDIKVLEVREGKVSEIDVPWYGQFPPPEEQFIHPEDKKLYDSYRSVTIGAIKWLNSTDLSVGIEVRVLLKGQDVKAQELRISQSVVLSFTGNHCTITRSICDGYERILDRLFRHLR